MTESNKNANCQRNGTVQGSSEGKHPMLDVGVWYSMDGLKLLLECSGDEEEQNNFYNGWTGDPYISALLVFCPCFETEAHL
jgi:hypothetical protein